MTGSGTQYTYDANGNMLTDELNRNRDIKYDHRNLITQIRNKKIVYEDSLVYATYYFYDEAGNRIRKNVYQYIGIQPSDSVETPDIGDITDMTGYWDLIKDEVYSRDLSGKEVVLYVNGNIMQNNIWGLGNEGYITSAGALNFYLKDHLGSIRAVTDENNSVISAQDYDCWGYLMQSRQYDSDESVYKFTGKERDEESFYDYFGARYYDSRIGRWGQVDPLASNEPGKTPYHYTSDNPINKIDPEGLDDIYYKNGIEVDRRESGFFDFDWLFGDTYFVQSESGNVEFNGNFYFEALSEATVKQFKGWNKVYSNWESSFSEEGFITRFSDAVSTSPSDLYGRYKYALAQSPTGGNLDQKRFLHQSTLYIYNNIAMNYEEAGNTIFGAAINQLGLDLGIANIAGHVYSVYANKRFDEYNEVQAYTIGYYNFNSGSSYFRNRSTLQFR